MSSVVVKYTTEHKGTARQAKYDQIRSLQAQLEATLTKISNLKNGIEEEVETKPVPKRKKSKSTTQEDIDIALAKKLQQEDGEMEVEDDEDFERPKSRKKRGPPRIRN